MTTTAQTTEIQHPSYTAGRPADWTLIPEYMIGGLRRYIEQGIEPGSFLSAVLANDLKEAVGRTDDVNRNRLGDYVMFFYNYAPGDCWGSDEKFQAWLKRGGLQGHEAAS